MKISRTEVRATIAAAVLLVATGAGAAVTESRLIRNARFFDSGLSTDISDPVDLLHVADFNRDGHRDVLIAIEGSVRVAPGNGAGLFGTGLASPATGFIAAGIADFNGDAVPDLYLRDSEGRGFGVMLGRGDGAFSTVRRFDTPGVVMQTTAGDFNGDGHADMVITSPQAINPTFYAGDGNGGFSGPAGSTVASTYDRIVGGKTGDFDGDGKLDLLTTGTNAALFFGHGDGTFQQPSTVPGGPAIGDFDGDGRADIVATRDYDLPAVYFGNAARNLTAATFRTFGWRRPIAADIDGDGLSEFVGLKGERVGISESTGTQSMTRTRSFALSVWILRAQIADVDGDSIADLITAHQVSGSRIVFALTRGQGQGNFDAARAFDSGLWSNYAGDQIEFADVNGDSRPDILTTGCTTYLGAGCALAVFFRTAAGDYEEPVLTAADFTRAKPAGDLDDDGVPDFILERNSAWGDSLRWVVMLGRRDGSFAEGYSWPGVARSQIARLTDATGDGKIDLIDDAGNLFPGAGDGSFGAGVPAAPSGTVFLDLNGDGRLDQVVSTGTSFFARLGQADGTYGPSIVSLGGSMIAFGDMNEDGFPDIVNAGAVYLGQGDGSFAYPILSPVSGRYDSIFHSSVTPDERWNTADLDGDLHLDLASGSTIYFGDGTGRFADMATMRVNDQSSTSSRIAEIDGDIAPELFTPHGTIIQLRGGTAGVLPSTVTLTAPTAPSEYLQSTTFTATIAGTSPSSMIPSGTVRFTGGLNEITVPVDWTGKASAHLIFGVGPTTVTATYDGDGHLAGSSAAVAHSGVAATTVSEVILLPNASFSYGSPMYFGARAFTAFTGPMPPGEVVLKKGEVILGSLPNRRQWEQPTWIQVVDREILPLGSHAITAHYAGNGNYLPSTSQPVIIEVTKAIPPMVLTVPQGILTAGQAASLRVDFTNRPYVTGTVTFSIENVVIGTVPVTNGSASVTTTFDGWGFRRSIRAEYSGDENHHAIYGTATIDVSRDSMQTTPWIRTVPHWEYGAWRIEVIVSPVAGAAYYDLYRRMAGGSWTFWQTFVPATFWWSSDNNVPNGEARFYRAVARDAAGNMTQPGPAAIGLGLQFSDDPIVPGSTVIKAAHITEMQQATNAIRVAAGLPPFAFAPVAAGGFIGSSDFADVHRTFIEACVAAEVPLSLTSPVPGVGVAVRGAHIQELRDRTR